jgi:hypothetical protein
MYEHRNQPLLTRAQFLRRLANHGGIALALLALSLAAGTVGYHFTDELSWLDAMTNAAMILSGMGQVSPLVSTEAKIFASVYALFSGVMFLALAGLVLAPILHRIQHRLHLDADDH